MLREILRIYNDRSDNQVRVVELSFISSLRNRSDSFILLYTQEKIFRFRRLHMTNVGSNVGIHVGL